ncbi:hypothetical protein C7R87_2330 [Acinetobacter baumannii]|nr:hypothetical protein C7R87_2330 [Acinetobacter baumannii]
MSEKKYSALLSTKWLLPKTPEKCKLFKSNIRYVETLIDFN